ncbi:MAG: putative toxin-antitoxin system toxin component, PIN family [Terracidiphilus sp.]
MSAAIKARVVFDTNIVLSALLFTHGRLSWLVGHWQAANCVPLISRATAEELTRILAYPKFHLTTEEKMEALASYIPFCEAPGIAKSCPVLCRDPKDQPFLDLAQAGNADVLVTGDEDLLALAGQTAFVIERPEEYRRRLSIDEIKR